MAVGTYDAFETSSTQGVPKVRSSTLQVCISERLDLVTKSFQQKLSFNIIHYFHTSCAIF